MRFRDYVLNETAAKGGVKKYFKELKKMGPAKAERTMRNAWKDLSNLLKKELLERDAIEIINRNLKTNYRSLDQIDKATIKKLRSSKLVKEDFKHYWNLVKDEAFPTLAFYPALTAWLELDKLLSGQDFNETKFGIYALFWVILVSGKFLKGWERWKKENPEEFEKEGAKKNPFAVK